MDAPLLSATLIVRNEEKFLAGCLDSLVGFADEIVVVDTGSTDATPRIATDRGIVVHSFPWVDDFSAARNRALDLATGRWILYIDADERVRSGVDNVRSRLLDPRYLAFQVLLTPKQGVTPYWILRLWRNHPSIRFRGIVHENIWPALAEFKNAFGVRSATFAWNSNTSATKATWPSRTTAICRSSNVPSNWIRSASIAGVIWPPSRCNLETRKRRKTPGARQWKLFDCARTLHRMTACPG